MRYKKRKTKNSPAEAKSPILPSAPADYVTLWRFSENAHVSSSTIIEFVSQLSHAAAEEFGEIQLFQNNSQPIPCLSPAQVAYLQNHLPQIVLQSPPADVITMSAFAQKCKIATGLLLYLISDMYEEDLEELGEIRWYKDARNVPHQYLNKKQQTILKRTALAPITASGSKGFISLSAYAKKYPIPMDKVMQIIAEMPEEPRLEFEGFTAIVKQTGMKRKYLTLRQAKLLDDYIAKNHSIASQSQVIMGEPPEDYIKLWQFESDSQVSTTAIISFISFLPEEEKKKFGNIKVFCPKRRPIKYLSPSQIAYLKNHLPQLIYLPPPPDVMRLYDFARQNHTSEDTLRNFIAKLDETTKAQFGEIKKYKSKRGAIIECLNLKQQDFLLNNAPTIVIPSPPKCCETIPEFAKKHHVTPETVGMIIAEITGKEPEKLGDFKEFRTYHGKTSIYLSPAQKKILENYLPKNRKKQPNKQKKLGKSSKLKTPPDDYITLNAFSKQHHISPNTILKRIASLPSKEKKEFGRIKKYLNSNKMESRYLSPAQVVYLEKSEG